MKLLRKLRKYLIREEWVVAVRPIGEKRLYQDGGTKEPFKAIPNSFRYWCADPFIITVGDNDYLFFEMFDRFKGKGAIGYRVIDKNGKIGKMKKAYESEHHLSFPFIFEYAGNFYMMPESSYDRNLTLLRAKQFPNQWEIVKTWFSGEKVCDSVMFKEGEDVFLLTQPVEYPYTHAKLDLYIMKNGEWVPCCENPVVNDNTHARMAGRIICDERTMIRPSQNCQTYGEAINFHSIIRVNENSFSEVLLKSISANEVTIHNMRDSVEGIHTYNKSARFETIDIKNVSRVKFGYLFSLTRRC